MGKLPSEDGEQYYQLWLEYEEQSSYEAKIVKALDKLEAKLQVIDSTQGHVFQISGSPMYEIGKEEVQFEPIMKELFDELISEFDSLYTEYTK